MKLGRCFLIAALCASSAFVIGKSHARVNKLLGLHPLSHPENVLPSADALKLCSLGYDLPLADCYWLGFIQYVGDTEERAKDRFAAADKYLDLVVGLDPSFIQAYWFQAFIVGSEQHHPDRAAQFIDKGIHANPNNWSLPFIAGINQYLYAHNDVAAAKYYRMAAKFPEAPPWLGRQAGILEAHIPSIIKEINAWDSIFHSKDQGALIRERARNKLLTLWRRVLNSTSTDAIRKKAESAINELSSDKL
jgi:hypothetical protein